MMLYTALGMQDIDIAARLDCSPDSIARRRARFSASWRARAALALELHRVVVERGVIEASASMIWRWLQEDAIKSWQTRSWIFPGATPDFAEQAGRALDLYARTFEGATRLRPGGVRDQR
jgi:hypothetical protein